MILTFFSFLSYLVATSLIVLQLRTMNIRSSWQGQWSKALWGLGLLSHAVIISDGISDLHLDFFHAASTISFLIALLLLATIVKRPLEILALITLPIAASILLLDLYMPATSFTIYNNAPGLKLHIFISLVAYSLLALAAVLAIVLTIQNRMLHNHHAGGIVRRLPPLTHMENLLFQFIISGFTLLSLALISGFVFLENVFAQHQAHKSLLSIIAWIIFAALLFGRWRWGWRGRTAVRWTLSGYSVLLLAYFGSKMVIELILY